MLNSVDHIRSTQSINNYLNNSNLQNGSQQLNYPHLSTQLNASSAQNSHSILNQSNSNPNYSQSYNIQAKSHLFSNLPSSSSPSPLSSYYPSTSPIQIMKESTDTQNNFSQQNNSHKSSNKSLISPLNKMLQEEDSFISNAFNHHNNLAANYDSSVETSHAYLYSPPKNVAAYTPSIQFLLSNENIKDKPRNNKEDYNPKIYYQEGEDHKGSLENKKYQENMLKIREMFQKSGELISTDFSPIAKQTQDQKGSSNNTRFEQKIYEGQENHQTQNNNILSSRVAHRQVSKKEPISPQCLSDVNRPFLRKKATLIINNSASERSPISYLHSPYINTENQIISSYKNQSPGCVKVHNCVKVHKGQNKNKTEMQAQIEVLKRKNDALEDIWQVVRCRNESFKKEYCMAAIDDKSIKWNDQISMILLNLEAGQASHLRKEVIALVQDITFHSIR